MTLSSEFAFALCQRGAERALKRELTRVLPSWAPAYQRPGVVTFRAPERVGPELALTSVFARSYGMSLGTATDASGLLERLRGVNEPLCLQVVERDLYRPDEEPPSYVRGVLAAQIEATVRSAAPALFTADGLARPGQLVLSVIVAEGDPWLLGLHRHAPGRCPHAGGRYPIEVPVDSPSRAFAKIEEAIAMFELPVCAGDVALEIGAAPGGAAYALLRRGVRVVGVDPGAMDARVLAFTGPREARLTHLAMPVAALTKQHLPAQVDWLLLDVHLAPQVALRSARRVASLLKGQLLGAVLTLKLNDWAFADHIDSFIGQAREIGLISPEARQLCSNRQELALAGLTQLGLERKRAQARHTA